MTKFQKKKCLEAAEQKTSKLLVVVCCCKTVAHGAALQENDVTHARAVGGTKTLHRVDIAKDRSAFLFFD